MERTESKYQKQAVENGCLVISACGFDSVPAELGWMFNSRQWLAHTAPYQIEPYLIEFGITAKAGGDGCPHQWPANPYLSWYTSTLTSPPKEEGADGE